MYHKKSHIFFFGNSLGPLKSFFFRKCLRLFFSKILLEISQKVNSSAPGNLFGRSLRCFFRNFNKISYFFQNSRVVRMCMQQFIQKLYQKFSPTFFSSGNLCRSSPKNTSKKFVRILLEVIFEILKSAIGGPEVSP